MPHANASSPRTARKSLLDRALSLFTDVRAGEGATAVLMLANIFLLLVCYSVIKTVREPLILLGGGAEVRSYAAGGQALLLMGFVPLYSWFATRVNRARLLVVGTLFFIGCIELFASAVAARVPYVGVAFFIWVGIFNVSLVAQFWSFASDIYSKEAGDRLFPIIVIGMTAGAPLGSFVAARLFRSAVPPQVILQVAAALLGVSLLLYRTINRRQESLAAMPEARLAAGGGFRLVLNNDRLRLIAVLVVLLNVVNTTGEYLVARLLSDHVTVLAAADAAFNKQAYIGAFSGDYQFWVNVVAFFLQAFVTSRLVKYRGLGGVLLALPLIAFGGYTIIAAGVGFSVVRWIKTAENATDYSIMNTARQLLWLPTSREEKYKAKQAIDTFFVRAGDVLSAGVVYFGARVLHLGIDQFAVANVALTLAWIGVAIMILQPHRWARRIALKPLATAAAALAILAFAAPGFAQETREEQLAAERARKATELHPYELTRLEERIDKADKALTFFTTSPVYPFVGSVFDGGGIAVGPGYRLRLGDTAKVNAHAAWSFRNYKAVDAAFTLPTMAHGRLSVEVAANWLDAPDVAFYGTGNESRTENRQGFSYTAFDLGVSTRVRAARFFFVGGGLDSIRLQTGPSAPGTRIAALTPNYRRVRAFAEIDSRTSRSYSRRGGLYRVEWSDYRQSNAGANSFGRVDAEMQQFVPVVRENWVIALRALASTTNTESGQDVPYFMMPDLGGHHALRGYSSWRFRDRNRVLLTGEYRWTAGSFVDMSLFLDAGQVSSALGNLSTREFKETYGVGISLHTLTTTVTRIELARTHEGNSVVFSFGPSF